MWVKLDDSFFSHPKAVQAGPDACVLFLGALCYAARHLTDGQIPAGIIGTLVPALRNPTKLAEKLVTAGLWEPTPNGWMIHDYLDYQPSRAQVEARRQALAGRVRNHRARNAVTNAVTNGVSNASPVLVPSLSLSETTQRERNGARSLSADESRIDPNFEAFWQAYPRKANRPEAIKLWHALAPDDTLVTKILEAVKRQQQSVQWDGGAVPNPDTWLDKRQWTYELPMMKPRVPGSGPGGFFDPR